MLHLRNPHSVLAALETRPHDVVKIVLPALSKSESLVREKRGRETQGTPLDQPHRISTAAAVTTGANEIGWPTVRKRALELKIEISTSMGTGESGPSRGRNPREQKHLASSSNLGGRESVAEAWVKERSGFSAEELFRGAKDRAQGKGLWLALDCLQDPHNVGAIFRTAAFFGVQGILLTQERSAPLTSTVYDVASGGMEAVPFAIQTNLQRGFEIAKENDLWILGTSEHARGSLEKITADRPWLLVLGNEEKGMRRLTEEACDELCKIPTRGKVGSLNVSVAAGILISHLTL